MTSATITFSRRPFPLSFAAAIAFHGLLLLFSGIVFVKGPEYGIDLGRGGMEVYLVAAPLQVKTSQAQEKTTSIRQEVINEDPQSEMTLPILAAPPELDHKKGIQKMESKLTAEKTSVQGDGSSQVSGLDTTTLYSEGGAWTEEKSGYLKNPAPYYPEAAIEMGQEGLVVVSVLVNKEGRAERAALKESSGFPLLDKSALQTLVKWKFNPGRLGFLTRETWVAIPVRFRLQDVKEKN